jgi:hypothetical protein
MVLALDFLDGGNLPRLARNGDAGVALDAHVDVLAEPAIDAF